MRLGLEGKVALVTAASKGLGKASALGLARAGCDLAICSRDRAVIEAVGEEIRQATGRRVLAMQADVSQASDVDRLVATTAETFGGIDILLSNTGGPPPGYIEAIDDATWQSAFESVMMSAVRLTRAVLPVMRARGGGRILYITSASFKQPIGNMLLSNTLRAGLTGMMKTVSNQVAKDKIMVNCVAPGRIDTERVQFLDEVTAKNSGKSTEAARQDWFNRIPAGRYGTPEEFANAVVFLASEAASFITGTTFMVDGGQINTLV